MAKVCKFAKQLKKPRYQSRAKNRCRICGRSRSYMRLFGLCRLCFRKLAHKGELPGVSKASW